ncbi:hypothetical protein [Leifsonia sp. Leaf264]|uniref:hypothetical protein n=1 Tax=Leifsonia sp. Leaf264 TaxID=1736314 RepID=UPI0012F871F3|nr:hypothetical protein [Leifsonia sp. Leaf264]
MIDQPHLLLDPEFVIPSDAASAKTEFWARMLGRADDRAIKIGPATLEALQDLTASPPPSSAIAERDFWRILTLYMSRGFISSGPPRVVCKTHLGDQYQPALGHPGNVARLISDVAAFGGESPLLLSTLPEVWSTSTSTCLECIKTRLVRLTSDFDSPTSRAAAAQAWRALFLDEHGNDLSLLPTFAPVMFPSLKFDELAWSHLRALNGDNTENVTKLVQHLGVLNDQAPAIWAENTETIDRQSALGSFGITASPEGSNTRRNTRKMRMRDFTIDDTLVRCEWHTKLRPNINRVYFAVKEAEVYVGVIIDHLPT